MMEEKDFQDNSDLLEAGELASLPKSPVEHLVVLMVASLHKD